MLGVCYYPEHWPEPWWAEDAAAMRDLGITYVRIGEFAWSRMEPASGTYEWGWLDRAIDVLGAAGLKVVLCTPTATPPQWLIDTYPGILPVDRNGRTRGFGSRRHYSTSSPDWLRETRRIVTLMAERYGAHPAVAGWQTDNEFGCHDTTVSYGPHDLAAFRDWLRRRYQTPEALNEAWGNVFWSMEASGFDSVPLPVGAVTETNPAARLDYQRFASAQMAAYNRLQVEIIRRHSPGRFVTHNFMAFFQAFDHFAVAEPLDFASWDSYPLGALEVSSLPETERLRWAETSHPDIPAFNHDLYRAVGRGRFWLMEHQPGPVNWAPWNPVPAAGVVRLWSWQCFAHGAEVLSYFRWRQAPFAQEQMHAGLHLPDRSRSPGGEEAAQVARELAALGPLPPMTQAPVAIVIDYEAAWIAQIQPQGRDFRYFDLVFQWYGALRRLGVDVDIVQSGAVLDGYRLIAVPTLPYVSDAALAALREADGFILFGPRTGSKTRDFEIPSSLPPGPVQELLPLRIRQVGSLRPGLTHAIIGEGVAGEAVRWREWLETELPAGLTFGDGTKALVGDGRQHYLAAWTDDGLLIEVMARLLGQAGLPVMRLPEGVRLQRRGRLTFAFNFSGEAWEAPCVETAHFRIGGRTVPPRGVSCWD
ncbi:MAG: beta-galactosidase [Proteobacteria bacterium]|nr:beta-galactosidase [Pseudomonadota bacterium]